MWLPLPCNCLTLQYTDHYKYGRTSKHVMWLSSAKTETKYLVYNSSINPWWATLDLGLEICISYIRDLGDLSADHREWHWKWKSIYDPKFILLVPPHLVPRFIALLCSFTAGSSTFSQLARVLLPAYRVSTIQSVKWGFDYNYAIHRPHFTKFFKMCEMYLQRVFSSMPEINSYSKQCRHRLNPLLKGISLCQPNLNYLYLRRIWWKVCTNEKVLESSSGFPDNASDSSPALLHAIFSEK